LGPREIRTTATTLRGLDHQANLGWLHSGAGVCVSFSRSSFAPSGLCAVLHGRIVSIQRDSVYLRRTLDGPVRRFGSGDIQQVDVRFPGTNRQRRTIVGSLVGGAVGVAGGIYASGGGACSDCVATTQDLILGTLLFTGAFSALGGIVGYATTPARWVPAQIPR
jgi:hypothetical protein